MRSNDDPRRSNRTSQAERLILQYLFHKFPDCADIDSINFAKFEDDMDFIGAMEALRDDGLILYEQFVRDGINPPLFVMASLSIKGERLARDTCQII
jgi:hypothetical protein